ncbi:hypothetical protein ACFL5U_02450 [Candidatus Margulisiibacteriota bacterium]
MTGKIIRGDLMPVFVPFRGWMTIDSSVMLHRLSWERKILCARTSLDTARGPRAPARVQITSPWLQTLRDFLVREVVPNRFDQAEFDQGPGAVLDVFGGNREVEAVKILAGMKTSWPRISFIFDEGLAELPGLGFSPLWVGFTPRSADRTDVMDLYRGLCWRARDFG